jgi:hypothetical protein
MNAKIAKFSPNQIATVAIKICIYFAPPDEGETPHDSRLTNRHKVLWAKCGSQMRAVFG